MITHLTTEAAAAAIVFFPLLILAGFGWLACVMVGTVEGKEARPLDAAVTWMRRHQARHRRGGRRLKAQWDIQLAHAGGRYEELPTLREYDTDTLRLFRDLNEGNDDASVPRPRVWAGDSLRDAGLSPALVSGTEGQAVGSLVSLEERRGSGDGSSYGSDQGGHRLDDALTPRTSIFDRLSDTDCFAAISWDVRRAVNELAVLQRDLWAGYKLPPWKGRKR